MRIEFPHAAREDFHWSQAQLRIGSAPSNDLVLAAAQAAPHHVRVMMDRRGWVLHVLGGAGRIYVNARPVREQALLRAGDVVSVGDCRLLLCADQDPATRQVGPVSGEHACTAALRAVSGPLSGKLMALPEPGDSARRPDLVLELPQGETMSLRTVWREGRLFVEVVQPSVRHALRVNGTKVECVPLQPGDQIGVATHRFVLEAPGMLAEAPMTATEPPEPRATEPGASSGGTWWLILTAVLLALGIALALLIRL